MPPPQIKTAQTDVDELSARISKADSKAEAPIAMGLGCSEVLITRFSHSYLGDGFGYFYFQPLLGDDWTL